MKFFKTPLLVAIAIYRKAISPLLPASCRFYPSCSQYAAEAVDRYGAGRGALMALKRVARCHPWHRGGYDPVPPVHSIPTGNASTAETGGVTGVKTGATPN